MSLGLEGKVETATRIGMEGDVAGGRGGDGDEGSREAALGLEGKLEKATSLGLEGLF